MSDLDEILKSLRKLSDPKTIAEAVAKRGATEIQRSLESTLAAGTDPEGKPWDPKKDGGRAYPNAAAKLKVQAFGDLVVAQVTGHEAYGNFGTAHLPVRRLLPDGGSGTPPSVEKALTKAAKDVLEELSK